MTIGGRRDVWLIALAVNFIMSRRRTMNRNRTRIEKDTRIYATTLVTGTVVKTV